MDLISKADRDNLDLNSLERAIIWSALTLRASNTAYANEPENEGYIYENSVRIALARAVVDGALTATLRIEATLPYVKAFGIGSGGKFIFWLHEMYEGPAENYTGKSCSVLASNGFGVSGDGNGLPDQPNYVTTLEQYFLWVCWEAELSLLSPLPSQLLPITVDFFEESRPFPTIKVVANVPIDYLLYKNSGNLVCSCLPLSSQISPAGLRSFSWEEITGKPTFGDVAFSGDYADLTNIPSIPSSLDELNRFNELVRTINDTAPDPVTGNVDLTLDVGSVDWANVNNKPIWHSVAFSGDYNDLINPPSIPVLEWNNITGKPTWHTVAFSGDYADLINTPSIPVLEWNNITGKPTWHTVAFSGSYEDLLDKPDLSGGTNGNAFLGKKILTIDTVVDVPFNFNGDNSGIMNWFGTNQNNETFDTANYSNITILDFSTSTQNDFIAFDQNTNTTGSIKYDTVESKIDFVNWKVSLNHVTIYGALQSSSYTVDLDIEGSNDDALWENIGTISMSGNTSNWATAIIANNAFYQYIRLKINNYTGGNTNSYVNIRELELYGQVQANNILDGSQSYTMSLSDMSYLLEPSASIGTINILPANTSGLNVGDRFYIFNPHAFNLVGVPASGDSFVTSNGLDYLAQGQTAEVVRVNQNQWFAY